MSSQRSIGKFSLFLASLALSFAAQSAVPNQLYRDALWVAESHGVLKLLAADSSIEVDIDSAEEVRAVAVDPVAGRVWVARTGRLLAYTFDGSVHQDLVLPSVDIGPVRLSVDRRDGSIWLARGSELQAYAFDGALISTQNLDNAIVAISQAPETGMRWTATEAVAQLRDDQGTVHAEFHAPSGEQIRDIAYDDALNSVWVLTSKFVHLLDLTSGAIVWTHGEKNFERIRLLDGEGAWIADDKQLIRLTATGQVLDTFDYAQPGNLVEFVVDGVDGSLWVASQQYLRHYSPSGNILNEVVLVADSNEGRIWSLEMYIDDLPPTVRFVTPADGLLTNNNRLPFLLKYTDLGIGTDPTTIAFTVNDTATGFQCTEQDESHADCVPNQGLPDGTNQVGATVADFNGNTSGPAEVDVTVDTVPPVITVTSPEEGAVVAASPITVTGKLSEASTLQVNGQVVAVDTELSFSTDVALSTGSNTIEFIATDFAGNSSQLGLSVELAPPSDLPPDPAKVASAIDPSKPTTVYESTRFLYTGDDPIQKDADPLAITPRRVAVLRGRVLDRGGHPLPGVTIRAHGHPEFGTTLSRADGKFDLVVNGGGQVTVAYEKQGFLPVQRSAEAPWRDFRWLPDVEMTEFDNQATHIDLTSTVPIQAASGSTVTDADGTRAATVMFPAGVSAEMVMPDGSRQALSALNVRATEYTVGEGGQEAMPGELPPTSAYTYAVELSVDEAVNVGATTVEFSEPVPFYVENFLDFPVGIDVPTGYYDREQAKWIASSDGRIIEILDIVDGKAVLDVTGAGSPTHSSTIQALGISDAELAELAIQYEINQTLWRVPIPHFTPWDHNWPYTFPDDAEPPFDVVDPPDPQEDDPTPCEGSIVECQNQVLGERIDVAGTPFTLNYRSNRVPGRRAPYELDIPVTGGSVPASLKRVEVRIAVAGRVFEQSFAALPYQSWQFEWDGKDAYGRQPLGAQTATVIVRNVYDGVYVESSSEFQESFGSTGEVAQLIGDRTRRELIMQQSTIVPVGIWDARIQGLGGWTISAQHSYDALRQELFLGTGKTARATNLNKVITRVAGNVDRSECDPCNFDGVPASEAGLSRPTDIVETPDGSVYFLDSGVGKVYRVDPDTDLIHLFVPTPPGNWIAGLAKGPDGRLYVGTATGIAAVEPNGTLRYLTGWPDFRTQDLAVAEDGSIYYAFGAAVHKLTPDGQRLLIAGQVNDRGYSGNGGPAKDALFTDIGGMTVGPDGALYVTDTGASVVRRIGTNGIIERFAGNEDLVFGYGGDGGPALDADMLSPRGMAFDKFGTLYIAESANEVIRKVHPNGIITTLAGINDRINCDFPTSEEEQHCEEDIAARNFSLYFPVGIAAGQNGDVFVGDFHRRQVLKVKSPLPEFTSDEVVIPSEDGNRVFVFDPLGKHLRTIDVVTGATIYRFEYGSNGHLTSIVDSHGNETSIVRLPDGTPEAIVGPYGQRTDLLLNSDSYLARVIDPLGHYHEFSYEYGLLRNIRDPNGGLYVFAYDAKGRLISDTDPVGGGWTISRSSTANGYEVTTSSAAGWHIQHQMEREADGSWSQTSTHPSGSISTHVTNPSGTVLAETSDDVVLETRLAPHPKLGPATPYVAQATASLPGGQTLAVERIVEYAPSSNAAFGEHDIADTVLINGRQFVSQYDAATRTWSRTSPEGRTATVQLNSVGQVVESRLGTLEPIVNTFNAQGRLSAVNQGTRNLTVAYDTQGFLAGVTDPALKSTTSVNDKMGRALEMYLPDNNLVSFDIDANGNVTGITPPDRPQHGFSYNGVNLVTAYSPPALPNNAGAVRTDYRVDRALDSETRIDGSAIDLSYGASSGLLSGVSGPTATYSYQYLPSSDQVVQATGPGSQQLDYTWNGPLLEQTTWSGDVNGTVDFDWNNDFQLASIGVGGLVIPYEYDMDGLTTKSGLLNLTYDVSNPLLESTNLDSVITNWAYNPLGESEGYTAKLADGTVLYQSTLTRDQTGRINIQSEIVNGTQNSYSYEYDPVGRLIEVQSNGVVVDTYSYDSNSNRLTHDGTVGVYDDQDRLLSYGDFDYSYTPNGELASRTNSVTGETTHYAYDAFNNLRNVDLPDGTHIEYIIDPQNRRIGKRVDGSKTQGFLYADQLNPVAELDGNDNIQSVFVYGSRLNVPDYMVRDGATYRIISDHLGSVRLVVNSQTGVVVQRLDYSPFGRVIHDSNPGFQPFGFAGGLYDRHTGLVRFGARDFDPTVGRWTNRDPSLFAGLSFSQYVYVNGDPINGTDVTGLMPWVGPWGEPLPQSVVDFSAAFGDTISLGLTDKFRDWRGTNGSVDKCSSAYAAGQWAGIGYGFAAGGASGFRAAGQKAAGKEFSHWIPNRYGGPRSSWNGNYVTPGRHYKHDPYRFPPKSQRSGDKWPGPIQQLDRVPNVYKGSGAGGGAAAASAAAQSCECGDE